jgi:hypothetical protein
LFLAVNVAANAGAPTTVVHAVLDVASERPRAIAAATDDVANDDGAAKAFSKASSPQPVVLNSTTRLRTVHFVGEWIGA